MPTYDYICKKCEKVFEFFQSMSDAPLTKCPDCGKQELRRIISGGTGLIFKGSGYYLTDYKNKKNSKSELPNNKDSKTLKEKNKKSKSKKEVEK